MPETALTDLIPQLRAATDQPLIAAGGLATASQLRDIVPLGADAVMVGTALLRTDESGAASCTRTRWSIPYAPVR